MMQMFSMFSTVTESNIVKRCLRVLIAIALVGILGPVSLSHKGEKKSWLFTSSPSILRLHFLNIKEKYVLIDNDKDNFILKASERSLKQFSVKNPGFVIYPINSHWVIFFNEVKSSPYILSSASLFLRSPPLFS
jgi:hypothetical protein